MTRKQTVLILIPVVIVVVILIAFSFYPQTESPPPSSLSPSPTASVSAPKAPIVPVQDIYQQPDNQYQIFYYPETNQYWILVMASPFNYYRFLAENQFLKQQNISKSAACQLNVTVTTPFFTNFADSDRLYPLSFCSP